VIDRLGRCIDAERQLPLMKRLLNPIGILLALIAGLAASTFTRGGRGYFAPDTLEFEVQSEYTIVDGKISLFRSQRQTVSYPLLDYLRQSGYIPVLPSPARKWEEEFHWNFAWKDGYSDFHRALTRRSDEFIEWSKADAERAKLYWSTYFRWRRSETERENSAAWNLLNLVRRPDSLEELRSVIADIETDFRLPHYETKR
jgi:hypothetical protein